MSFRKIPFQFTTTDPAERHSELMRRFGVPSDSEMLIDQTHLDGFLDPSSPRLQHRIPQCLAEGREAMFKQNLAENVDASKSKPRERIIPIQIEGVSSTTTSSNRQRTRSGDSVLNSRYVPADEARCASSMFSAAASSLDNQSQKTTHVSRETSQSSGPSKPKVVNIPVFVEGRDNKKCENKQKADPVNIPVKRVPSSKPEKPNGPCVTKPVKSETGVDSQIKKHKSASDISLDQIAAVIEELDCYKESVQSFSGVQGDKQYRYLDEMLTRCLLKLDDVETHGNEEVRKSRKAAIREVEKYVCMLDAKVKVTSSDDMTESDTGIAKDESKSTAVDSIVQGDTEMIHESMSNAEGIEQETLDKPVDSTSKDLASSNEPEDIEMKSNVPSHEEGGSEPIPEKQNHEISDCEKTVDCSENLPIARETELSKTQVGDTNGTTVEEDNKSDIVQNANELEEMQV